MPCYKFCLAVGSYSAGQKFSDVRFEIFTQVKIQVAL